jgi:DNA-directed RNA polymerase specialized sigma24 family protein
MLLVGSVLVAAGLLSHGRQTAVVTTLLVVGASQISLAILLPRISKFEIGPGGFKTELAATAEALPTVTLDCKPDKLTRFAYLVSGDRLQARELVEEALVRSRERRHGRSALERDAFTMRLLVDLLDTARERRWLLGKIAARPPDLEASSPAAADPGVVKALQDLTFPIRVAFLLRADWGLALDDVAKVLQRPVDVVGADVQTARDLLRQQIEPEFDAADSITNQ